jgi:photosystem II stability/assembly factor-like uncharacterized protein
MKVNTWKKGNSFSTLLNVKFCVSILYLLCMVSTPIAMVLKWKAVRQFSVPVSSITIDWKNRAFVCTSPGMFRSLDNGTHWDSIPGYFGEIKAKDSSLFRLGGAFTGFSLMRSTDGGNSWDSIRGIGTSSCYLEQFEIHPNNDFFGRISSGMTCRGIYRSQNYGSNWNYITGPVIYPSTLSISFNGDIFVNMYRSRDLGDTWVDLNEGLPARIDTSLSRGISSCTVVDSGVLLAVDSWQGQVLRSMDDGEHWASVFQAKINDTSVFWNARRLSIVVDSLKNVFIASRIGILWSGDSGKSWGRVNEGLSDTNINILALDQNRNLYAVSTAGMLFHSSTPTSPILRNREEPRAILSEPQLTLRAADGTVSFHFYNVRPCHTSLILYNCSGQRIRTLIDGFRDVGRYTFSLCKKELLDGLYLCCLKQNGRVISSQLLRNR